MTKKVKQQLTCFPMGGLGEIGMNMMAYECNDEMIIVDAGITFPDNFAPGTDVVIPDIHYARERVKRLKGIFITHAHEDHIGGLQYIWDELDAPVYLTQFARCVLERKLNEMGIEPAEGRIVTVTPGTRVKAGDNFEVEFVELTHSTIEMCSFAIRTPHGLIFHTGDYKLDENPTLGNASDIKRLKEIGDEGVLAMLGDSTNIFHRGSVGSEGVLTKSLIEVIAKPKQRIFFSTFSSNIGRVLKAAEIAVNHNRKVCFLSRSTRNMVDNARKSGYFPNNITEHLVSPEEAAKLPRNHVCIIASGTQGETNSALSFLARGESFKGLRLEEGDTVVMSSKFIPGNERAILNMMNNMAQTGAEIVHEKTADVHVSGHGGRDEIKKVYELIRPKMAVPVHGEYMHLKEHAKFAKEECGVEKTFVITNGTKFKFGPDEVGVMHQETHKSGRNYVDGFNIIDNDLFIIKERKQMAMNGLATVVVTVDSQTREVLGDPVVSTRGLIDEDAQEDLVEMVQDEVLSALNQKFGNQLNDLMAAQEVIRLAVRRTFNRERGRKPVTVPLVVEV